MLYGQQIQEKGSEEQPAAAKRVATVVDHPTHRRTMRGRRHQRRH